MYLLSIYLIIQDFQNFAAKMHFWRQIVMLTQFLPLHPLKYLTQIFNTLHLFNPQKALKLFKMLPPRPNSN